MTAQTIQQVQFETVVSQVQRRHQTLITLSHSLHAEPEVAMQEHKSAAKVAHLARQEGFDVTVGVAGLPTALTAERGSGGLTLGVCVEYDALPDIGHACGHNVHGAAAVGAALALGALADELDITVKLIGTPAEEGEGGKIYLLDAGVFDDVSAAMMVHASDSDTINGSSLAMSCWEVTFQGRRSHAATAPWLGVNALDAASVAYTAIGLLRQQLPPGSIVSFALGDAGSGPVNVIPSLVRARVEVRAPSIDQLRDVQGRIRACLDAGALATGADMIVVPRGRDFAELRQDKFMSAAYRDGLRRLGRHPVDVGGAPQGSTDMGNVSALIASIHPTIGYDLAGAPHHSADFTEHGTSPTADRAVIDAAIALAWTGVRVATDAPTRHRLLARSSASADRG